MQNIREHLEEIRVRIRQRSAEIESLSTVEKDEPAEEMQRGPAAERATEDRVEEIRQSVTDERIQERVERISQSADSGGEERPGSPERGENDEEGSR
jgi:hypothetical protein